MSLFVVDTCGDKDLFQRNDAENVCFENINKFNSDIKGNEIELGREIDGNNRNKFDDGESEDDSDYDSDKDYGGLPPPSEDISRIISKHLNSELNPFKKENVKRSFFSSFSSSKVKKDSNEIQQNLDEIITSDRQKEMTDGILKNAEISTYNFEILGKSKAKKIKKVEREKTKGSDWFNMPATEITDEIENDLKILQMRSILNPKHFYKKNDLKVLPKYFQIGTVQHSHLEFYNERNIRKNKKKTIVDEILADAEVNRYTKRKFQEITEKKERYKHKNAMKKMKKLKKNK